VQHEIFYSDQAVAWDLTDSIKIKVNCADDAERLEHTIPYGLMVTFELASGIKTDVYSTVVAKVREIIQITSTPIT
jgi:hypothetical protein